MSVSDSRRLGRVEFKRVTSGMDERREKRTGGNKETQIHT